MKLFKIIPTSDKQTKINTFKSKGRVVTKRGDLLSSQYKGHLYQVVSKEQLPLLQRFSHFFSRTLVSFAFLDFPFLFSLPGLIFEKKIVIYYIEPIDLSDQERSLIIRIDQEFSKNKKDPKALVNAAQRTARYDGGGTSKFIKNYRVTAEDDLVEIAKTAACSSAKGTSEYIKNYGITREKDLVEIAKTAARENGWQVSRYIKNYEIASEKGRIEVAKIAVQQNGEGTSLYIKNYGITSQQDLIEIAKTASRYYGRETSQHIKNYEIASEKGRIEVAKTAARYDGEGTSLYIKNYGITSQQELIQIAKTAARYDGEGTSQHIKNYGITNQQELIQIAKIAARYDGEGFVALYNRAGDLVWYDGEGVSAYIKNYGITNQQDLIEVAKISAQRDGRKTSKYIENYGITNQQDLIEVAKISAQYDGRGTSEYIKNYGVLNEEERIKIAKLAARENGWQVSRYIKNYEIASEKGRIEVAKTAAQQNGEGTSQYIENYEITEQEDLMQVVKLAIKGSIANNLAKNFWHHLSRCGFSQANLKKIRLLYACYMECNKNPSMQHFIDEYSYMECNKNPSMQLFITEIEKKISLEQDSQKLEKLQKKKQKALLYFSLVSEKCIDSNRSLTEEQQKYFIRALEYRHRKNSCFLMWSLAENFQKEQYFPRYEKLILSSQGQPLVHLILPMILVSEWMIESSSPLRSLDKKKLEKITDFLKKKQIRESFRSSEGFLSNLLQALIALSHLSTISLEQKIHLLNQFLRTDLPIDQGKNWKKHCKKSLDTLYILASMNLLDPILSELKDDDPFSSFILLFERELKSILLLDAFEDNFYEKYLTIEEKSRVPLALVKYAGNIKSCRETRVTQELQRLVTHILKDSLKEGRYEIENNPHLQKIHKDFPEIFQAWQITQEAIEIKPREEKHKSMNFLAFLKEKILTDNHLPKVPLELAQYLEGKPYSIENMKKTDQQIMRLFEILCNTSVDITEKLTILKELSPLIDQNEFKNDIDSLYMNLTETNKKKNVLVVDSDHWQDLFLSGTEVLGSCQRIDGDPILNVCLMAYVLDGKNRILCVKDPITGKILARCIFRLLLKDDQVVLFQERIYPSSCKYVELLNKLAEIRARELDLELFTCNTRDNLSLEKFTLKSLGSCSPYEYADASGGKTKGAFSIHMAKKVILS
ncbi:MAG: hypothetical protein QG627_665 [Chlamydiota bacterium]|nr:hypothetical protein [Chlamydiota bacterium]